MRSDREATLTASKFSEVELQIVKMTNVTKDIRIVVQNILDAKELQKRVNEELLENFLSQLRSIIQNLRFFPTRRSKLKSLKASQKITECHQVDQHSEKVINGLKTSNLYLRDSNFTKDSGLRQVQDNDLMEINQQLIQENQFLTKKLEQAESHIKKTEYQNNLLISQLSTIRNEQKQVSKTSKTMQSIEDNCHLQIQIANQNQQLRAQLQQTKQFIMRNNEDFVRELQKYNQKIWKLQRDNQQYKNRLLISQGKSEQNELLIKKLREQNFKLQVLTRNMKAAIGQQQRRDNAREYAQGQNSDRLRVPNGRLKTFFRERVEQQFGKEGTY